MMPNVPTMEMGTATLGMTVAERLRRKRNMTMTTRTIVSMSVNSTSSTDARIVVVRSVRFVISMDDGIDALSWGIRRLMRSTTAMMLAPGWRWMFTMTAGLSFIHAASLTFSTPSMTSATSDSRTGALLRYVSTTVRYSAAVSNWSFAPIVNDCRGPSRLPLAWSTLAWPRTA